MQTLVYKDGCAPGEQRPEFHTLETEVKDAFSHTLVGS